MELSVQKPSKQYFFTTKSVSGTTRRFSAPDSATPLYPHNPPLAFPEVVLPAFLTTTGIEISSWLFPDAT